MLGHLPPLEGLLHSEAQFDRAASVIARAPQATRSDVVDLSAAAVALLESRNSFEANTKMIKAAEEMDAALIDSIG